MFDFTDKVVWISGSSSGIGKEAALNFARNGADVVVHCLNNIAKANNIVSEIRKLGRKSIVLQGDISDIRKVNNFINKIDEEFGRLDLLVNNAGSLVQRSRLEDLEEEIWDRTINVNLKSIYLVTKASLPLLKKSEKGNIINVTSIAARNGGRLGSLAYAAAKGGVSTLTKGLARDLAQYNIRVNGISPGVISTPFQEKFSSNEKIKDRVSSIPLGRLGKSADVVGSLLFLASDYSDYITGEIIEVNGGILMS